MSNTRYHVGDRVNVFRAQYYSVVVGGAEPEVVIDFDPNRGRGATVVAVNSRLYTVKLDAPNKGEMPIYAADLRKQPKPRIPSAHEVHRQHLRNYRLGRKAIRQARYSAKHNIGSY